MLKGLYSASSAMLANMERQRILAHNVSNVDTPGFKQILVSMNEFLETPLYFNDSISNSFGSPDYLGQLGLGVQPSEETTDYSMGSLTTTGQMLDLAIEGQGFFQLEIPEGTGYSRDGRFLRDAENYLVSVNGHYLLDSNGNRIQLDEGDVIIQADGRIVVNGTEGAQIGLASFEDPETELERHAPGVFIAEGQPTGEETGKIQQGALEGSNVDSAQLMTQMVTVARAYEAAQQLVRIQDELLGRSIQSLGNV